MANQANRKGFFNFSLYALLVLTILSFLTPYWVFKDFLFPFITSKAFYLRIFVEAALPFFVYVIVADKNLRPNYKNPLHISIFAFWIINIISALVGIDPIKALWGNFERMGGVFYLTHLILLYFYIVVLANANFSFLKTLLYSNFVIATALSLYAIFVRLGMTPWVPDPSLPRVSATLGNPIFLPSYLIPIMFLTFFWALRKQGFTRWFLFAVGFLQLVASYLSGTRGAVVGILLGSFIAAVAAIAFSQNKKVRVRGLSIVAVLVVVGLAFYLNSGKLPQGSMLRRVFQLNDTNSKARLIQWKVALKGFKDYPVFGTGAENYYITGNKYFNPEIYKYDPSWFDKPHNYFLEVLVTNGLLGFLAYISMLGLAIWAFYKSWKLEALELWACAVLLAGLLAYEIQNLFVFDTVSASMSFYIYFAFAAFLWEKIIQSKVSVENAKNQAKNRYQLNTVWPVLCFSLFLPICGFGIWAGNIVPLLASKNTNYGYAYASVDPKMAEDYFEKAVSEPLNFDQSETANKYEEFAVGFLRNASPSDAALADKVANNSLSALQAVVAKNPNNPINWEKLAGLYLNYSYFKQKPLDSNFYVSIEKAIELAPKRTEAMSFELQALTMQGRVDEAQSLAERIVNINPDSLDNQWQLSVVYEQSGKTAQAIAITEKLLSKDYQFPSLQSLTWVLDYYAKAGNWPRATEVAEKMVKIEPNNKDVYVALAEVYFQSGQKDKARTLAQKLLAADKDLAPKLAKYLQP